MIDKQEQRRLKAFAKNEKQQLITNIVKLKKYIESLDCNKNQEEINNIHRDLLNNVITDNYYDFIWTKLNY